MTADLPPTAAELFALAAEIYTPKGVHMWMNSRNKRHDGEVWRQRA